MKIECFGSTNLGKTESEKGLIQQIKEIDSLMQSISLTDLDNGFYIIHVVNEAGEEKSFFITKN